MIAGIDPGLTGGVAVCCRSVYNVFPMPVVGKSVDVLALSDILKGLARVYLEVPYISAKQAGGLTTGANYGRILAVCEIEKIPVTLVTPSVWTKKMLGNTGGDKSIAADWVRRNYPNVDLPATKAARTGCIDALLIAEYGRLHK
jgi:branched-subunit amino acid aminotransferase/4-amino-4-deoxychorismate lyase